MITPSATPDDAEANETTGEFATLGAEPFDALHDDPNSPTTARKQNEGVSGSPATPVLIAEVSTTVDPANAHDSVTSLSRQHDESHDGFLHLFPDHTDDAH